MLGMAGMQLSPRAARQQIASALTVVVQVARLSDGRRRVLSVQEITGMEGDIVTMQEVFAFRQTGVAACGTVEGSFTVAGIYPRFCERLQARGVALPAALFATAPRGMA